MLFDLALHGSRYLWFDQRPGPLQVASLKFHVLVCANFATGSVELVSACLPYLRGLPRPDHDTLNDELPLSLRIEELLCIFLKAL